MKNLATGLSFASKMNAIKKTKCYTFFLPDTGNYTYLSVAEQRF